MRKLALCALVLALAAPAMADDHNGDGDGPRLIVKTRSGKVRGFVEGDHVAFNGIPFAAPPVGPLRWRPTEPAAPWGGILDATQYGPRCLQDWGYPEGSEDCLTINLKVPAGAREGDDLPVIFLIHFAGSFGDNRDDTSALVEAGAIVVEPNHRLGVFGRFAHPRLTVEGDGTSANFGIYDQTEALRWVQRNIERFGGDPETVTLFGGSSASWDISAHLVNPMSKGLFHRAIFEVHTVFPFTYLEDAEWFGTQIAANAGCPADDGDTLECLRAKDWSTLNGAFTQTGDDWLGDSYSWILNRVVDGITIPEMPLFYGEGQTDIPLLIGHNASEDSWLFDVYWDWSLGLNQAGSWATMDVVMDYMLQPPWQEQDPRNTPTLKRLFPLMGQIDPAPISPPLIVNGVAWNRYLSPVHAVVSAQTDMDGGCFSRRVARNVAGVNGQGPAVYRWVNNHGWQNYPDTPIGDGSYTEKQFQELAGAGHVATLHLMTGLRWMRNFYVPTASELELADLAVNYAVNFARTGNPNGKQLPHWPQFDARKERFLMYHGNQGTPLVGTGEGWHRDECEFTMPYLERYMSSIVNFPWADIESCLQSSDCMTEWGWYLSVGIPAPPLP